MIKKCKNSTLQQAWILIEGLPTPIDLDDQVLLGALIRKRFPGAKTLPRLTINQDMQGKDSPSAPLWTYQFSVGKNIRYRLGHQYLSVHFVTDEAPSNYESFSTSLFPAFEDLLKIINEAEALKTMTIGKLGVGYINKFTVPSENFELGDHFNCEMAFDVGGRFDSMSRMDFEVQLLNDQSQERGLLRLELNATEDERLYMKTHVFSFYLPKDKLQLSQEETVRDEIYRIKEFSKDTFFSFCTDKTKSFMGADGYESELTKG